MDNNRTIIAVVLVVLLWSGYSLFFAPQAVPPQVTSVEAVTKENPVKQEGKQRTPSVDSPTSDVLPGSNEKESFLNVSSNYYDIKISSIGATIHSIVLKQYKETNAADSPPFHLLDSQNFALSTLKTSGSDGLFLPSNLSYKVLANKSSIDVKNEDVTVSFVATINDLTVVKNYTFHPSSYSFDLDIQLINNSKTVVSGRLNLSLISPWDKDSKSQMYTFVGPVTFNGEELGEDKPAGLEKSPKIYKKDIVWSGYMSNSSEMVYLWKISCVVLDKFAQFGELDLNLGITAVVLSGYPRKKLQSCRGGLFLPSYDRQSEHPQVAGMRESSC